MFHVYVLQSEKTGEYYRGSTGNLENRLNLHNEGSSRATKHACPRKTVYSEELPTRAEAMKREKYLKTGKGREEIASILRKAQLNQSPPRRAF